MKDKDKVKDKVKEYLEENKEENTISYKTIKIFYNLNYKFVDDIWEFKLWLKNKVIEPYKVDYKLYYNELDKFEEYRKVNKSKNLKLSLINWMSKTFNK